MNQHSRNWTPERVTMLEKLWADGLSATQIACEMGGTRNSVIGKVHRLRLAGRPKPESFGGGKQDKRGDNTRARNLARRSPKFNPEPMPKRPPRPDAPTPLMISILDLTSTTCRWPVGDPLDAGFGYCGCGCPVETPYCDYHDHVARLKS